MIPCALLLLLPLAAGALCFLLKSGKWACRLFTLVTFLLFSVSFFLTDSFSDQAKRSMKALRESRATAEVLVRSVDATPRHAPPSLLSHDALFSLWPDMIGIDGMAVHLILITCGMFFLASFYLPGFLRSEKLCSFGIHAHDPTLSTPRFVGCLLLFLGTMMLVLCARNFGLLWVAVEATTLASAPLISYHRSGHSLEAMWKYLLICSVGIGFALLGTMCLSLAGNISSGAGELSDLSFRSLSRGVHAGWFKAAFIFILAGYGTKMGLVPFHTWLPDAHSESPALVSALLSGTLLNCAFLSIWRVVSLVSGTQLQSFCTDLLLFFGFFSVLTATLFIIQQHDFKRMLAYSSVEHMGLIALYCALSLNQALSLHILGHTLLKGCLFLLAGNILCAYGTRTIPSVKHLFTRLPKNALLWLVGILALCGTPPSPLFLSEYQLLRKAFLTDRLWLAVALAILLFAIFAAMTHAALKMLFGGENSSDSASLPELSAEAKAAIEENAVIPRWLCLLALLLGALSLYSLLKGSFLL